MNIENIKIATAHYFYIIGIIFGIFLILSAMLNFEKLITGTIPNNKFKNKEKFIKNKRILIFLVGISFIVTFSLCLTNKLNKISFISICCGITLLFQFIHLLICKKYTF